MKDKNVRKLFWDEKEPINKLQEIVENTFKSEEFIIHNLSNPPIESFAPGQRISAVVAQFRGSWRFIILFFFVLTTWIICNVSTSDMLRFDPFPFILLNLILSCISALQAPKIMMSQNRQEGKDRKRSENDYLINLNVEIMIRSLNQKIDILLEERVKTLFEMQEKQFTLLNEISIKMDALHK